MVNGLLVNFKFHATFRPGRRRNRAIRVNACPARSHSGCGALRAPVFCAGVEDGCIRDRRFEAVRFAIAAARIADCFIRARVMISTTRARVPDIRFEVLRGSDEIVRRCLAGAE